MGEFEKEIQIVLLLFWKIYEEVVIYTHAFLTLTSQIVRYIAGQKVLRPSGSPGPLQGRTSQSRRLGLFQKFHQLHQVKF